MSALDILYKKKEMIEQEIRIREWNDQFIDMRDWNYDYKFECNTACLKSIFIDTQYKNWKNSIEDYIEDIERIAITSTDKSGQITQIGIIYELSDGSKKIEFFEFEENEKIIMKLDIYMEWKYYLIIDNQKIGYSQGCPFNNSQLKNSISDYYHEHR